MSQRIAITIVAVFTAILGGIVGVGSATAAEPPPTPCTAVFFNLSLGQGVEAFCDQAPATYQVMAQCSDGLDIWSVPGSLAVAGAGPSVAQCRGLLLFPAYVLSYFIVQ